LGWDQRRAKARGQVRPDCGTGRSEIQTGRFCGPAENLLFIAQFARREKFCFPLTSETPANEIRAARGWPAMHVFFIGWNAESLATRAPQWRAKNYSFH